MKTRSTGIYVLFAFIIINSVRPAWAGWSFQRFFQSTPRLHASFRCNYQAFDPSRSSTVPIEEKEVEGTLQPSQKNAQAFLFMGTDPALILKLSNGSSENEFPTYNVTMTVRDQMKQVVPFWLVSQYEQNYRDFEKKLESFEILIKDKGTLEIRSSNSEVNVLSPETATVLVTLPYKLLEKSPTGEMQPTPFSGNYACLFHFTTKRHYQLESEEKF